MCFQIFESHKDNILFHFPLCSYKKRTLELQALDSHGLLQSYDGNKIHNMFALFYDTLPKFAETIVVKLHYIIS